MMRMLPIFLLVLVFAWVPMSAQVTIDGYNNQRPDTLYWTASEGPPSSVTMTFDSTDKQEGAGALSVRSVIGAFHPWGSFTQFGYASSGAFWDWSLSDSMSIWIKVKTAPKQPEYMVFRIAIRDSISGQPWEEYIYEHATILDNASGWVNLRFPIRERATTGSEVPNDEGFILAPKSWGGFTYNNEKLDRDKIIQWSIGIVTSGWTGSVNLPADSIEVLFDSFTRFGLRSVPVVFFNGKSVNTAMSVFSWGQSAVEIATDAGPVPKTNAIKWTQGNEWGNGWTGMGYNVAPPFNIAGGWSKDSVKFTLKSDTGVGNLRVQFESGSAKVGKVFTPVANGQWNSYTFALRDMVPQDGTTGFDSSAVTVIGMMAEASGIAGKVVYITNWWTGNPVFDVIAPDAPTNVQVLGGGYVNLVSWTDTPGESGAKYNVYVGERSWSALETDSTVEDIPPYNIPAGAQTANHVLRAPKTDRNLTLYYGVTATDESGNVSPVGVSSAVTTMAKGVPTIAKTAPPSFVADGSLTEWAGIAPITLTKAGTSPTAHVAPGGVVADDNDLMVKAYLAVDATHLYVAFDVTDDQVTVDTTQVDYAQDCPDLFLGTYDWRGRRHGGYRRGVQPDYHFRFSKNRIYIDNSGGKILTYQFPGGVKNPNYTWTEKPIEPGYTVEAKISWTELAAAFGDQVFVPREGMRLPIDFSINDRDAKAYNAGAPWETRDAVLCYSTLNDDNSWQDMWRWTYTWIGDLMTPTSVAQVSDVAFTYELGQNYPNPFNPATTIRYSVPAEGHVSLRVYDLIGREVVTLFQGQQEAGSYAVTFNTSDISKHLTSGVYFYRLEAGTFVSTRKMVLLK